MFESFTKILWKEKRLWRQQFWEGEVAGGGDLRVDCRKETYPCEVELGLYTDHITFLLVLCAQNLQFCGIEGRFRIDGVYNCKSSQH